MEKMAITERQHVHGRLPAITDRQHVHGRLSAITDRQHVCSKASPPIKYYIACGAAQAHVCVVKDRQHLEARDLG